MLNKKILQVRYRIKKLLTVLAERFTIPQKEYIELNEFSIKILQQLAHELIAKLKINEASYRWLKNIGHNDACSFYLYSMVSEVLKAAISNMRTLEFIKDSMEEEKYCPKAKMRLSESTKDKKLAYIDRAIFEGFDDEQNLWRRKLSECLSNLICFTTTNEEPYFKLFIAANELSDLLFANDDFLEFFDCKIENINLQCQETFNIIQNVSKSMRKDECWFLKNNFKFDKIPTNGDFMQSYRQVFLKSFTLAEKGEKNVLGFTYQVGYGGMSKTAHFSTEGPSRDIDFERLTSGITAISITGYYVLRRAYEIYKVTPSEIGQKIFRELVEGTGAIQSHFLSTVRDYEQGDLLTTGNDLVEVLQVKTSKYGYKSYYVRYLVNPAIQSIEKEWLPARYIYKRIVKKSKVRDYYRDILKRNPDKEKEIAMIMQMSDEQLFESMKRVFVELAKHGILQNSLREQKKK